MNRGSHDLLTTAAVSAPEADDEAPASVPPRPTGSYEQALVEYEDLVDESMLEWEIGNGIIGDHSRD